MAHLSEEDMARLALNRLSLEETSTFKQHIRGCKGCKALLKKHWEALDTLKEAIKLAELRGETDDETILTGVSSPDKELEARLGLYLQLIPSGER